MRSLSVRPVIEWFFRFRFYRPPATDHNESRRANKPSARSTAPDTRRCYCLFILLFLFRLPPCPARAAVRVVFGSTTTRTRVPGPYCFSPGTFSTYWLLQQVDRTNKSSSISENRSTGEDKCYSSAEPRSPTARRYCALCTLIDIPVYWPYIHVTNYVRGGITTSGTRNHRTESLWSRRTTIRILRRADGQIDYGLS